MTKTMTFNSAETMNKTSKTSPSAPAVAKTLPKGILIPSKLKNLLNHVELKTIEKFINEYDVSKANNYCPEDYDMEGYKNGEGSPIFSSLLNKAKKLAKSEKLTFCDFIGLFPEILRDDVHFHIVVENNPTNNPKTNGEFILTRKDIMLKYDVRVTYKLRS